jgi:site-specific recombinase XerD
VTFPLAAFVRAFFEDYLVCQRNVSVRTIQSYRDSMRLFLRFMAERTRKNPSQLLVADITGKDVSEFLTHLEGKRRNSIQTRNYRLVAIRGLFNFIALQEPVLMEHCRRITAIPFKRQHAIPEIGYLEKNEMEAMLDAADLKTPLGRRDHAILLFMYNTGARVQETADARVSWLSLDPPPKVNILGKGRKWRTCPLWEAVAKELQALMAERPTAGSDDRPLFLNRYGSAMTRFGIWNLIRKYRNRAAETVATLKTKRVTPHTLRHTTAMHLLQSGVEINVIRSWLGHVNLATTHRYVEIDLAMKRKALASCELTVAADRKSRWRSAPDILSWLESL